MITAFFIGLWAFLFTGPLSDPEEVFGWLKALAYKHLDWFAYKPLIGCAKCHAGQVAFFWQAWRYMDGGGFNLAIIIASIAFSYTFERIDKLIEKWLNT